MIHRILDMRHNSGYKGHDEQDLGHKTWKTGFRQMIFNRKHDTGYWSQNIGHQIWYQGYGV